MEQEKNEAEEIKTHGVRVRFSDAPWFTWLAGRPVFVLGVGGIGSWTAFCLDRIGCVVTIWDDDVVEQHNIGGQMYGPSSIGGSKVEALEDVCARLTGIANTSLLIRDERYVASSYVCPITIAAFDNMAARKLAFEKWAASPLSKDGIFIDGRLLAEDYQIYAVLPGREEAYRRTLFSDDEIRAEPCTLKSTTHCSLGIAADIVALLTNFAANKVTMEGFGVEMRDVPFKVSKSLPIFDYRITLEPDGDGGNTEITEEKVKSDQESTAPVLT